MQIVPMAGARILAKLVMRAMLALMAIATAIFLAAIAALFLLARLLATALVATLGLRAMGIFHSCVLPLVRRRCCGNSSASAAVQGTGTGSENEAGGKEGGGEDSLELHDVLSLLTFVDARSNRKRHARKITSH